MTTSPPPFDAPVTSTARHVRLTQAHIDALFGKGHQLRAVCGLSQPSEFAAIETVAVRGSQGTIEQVRVVGPAVKQTRVELTVSDCEILDGECEPRLSRRVDGSGSCTIEGPAGTVVLAEGVLNVGRYLRIAPDEAARHQFVEEQRVYVRVEGERARNFHDVIVGIEDGVVSEFVLDAEEASSIELGPKARATIQATKF